MGSCIQPANKLCGWNEHSQDCDTHRITPSLADHERDDIDPSILGACQYPASEICGWHENALSCRTHRASALRRNRN